MKRVAPVFLFVLVIVAAALAYPLGMRGSEWLAVRWDNKWALLLLLAVPVLFVRSLWNADDRVPRVRLGTP